MTQFKYVEENKTLRDCHWFSFFTPATSWNTPPSTIHDCLHYHDPPGDKHSWLEITHFHKENACTFMLDFLRLPEPIGLTTSRNLISWCFHCFLPKMSVNPRGNCSSISHLLRESRNIIESKMTSEWDIKTSRLMSDCWNTAYLETYQQRSIPLWHSRCWWVYRDPYIGLW